MKQLSTVVYKVALSIFPLVLIFAMLLLLYFFPSLGIAFLPKLDHIRDLPQLPLAGISHFQGVVTYADSSAKRFWVQDGTGAKAVAQSLTTLAHNLDMQVILEGIETPEQLAMIKRFGGNAVQGYLLRRPTADPINLLSQNNSTIEVGKIKVTLPVSVLKTDS